MVAVPEYIYIYIIILIIIGPATRCNHRARLLGQQNAPRSGETSDEFVGLYCDVYMAMC